MKVKELIHILQSFDGEMEVRYQQLPESYPSDYEALSINAIKEVGIRYDEDKQNFLQEGYVVDKSSDKRTILLINEL